MGEKTPIHQQKIHQLLTLNLREHSNIRMDTAVHIPRTRKAEATGSWVSSHPGLHRIQSQRGLPRDCLKTKQPQNDYSSVKILHIKKTGKKHYNVTRYYFSGATKMPTKIIFSYKYPPAFTHNKNLIYNESVSHFVSSFILISCISYSLVLQWSFNKKWKKVPIPN